MKKLIVFDLDGTLAESKAKLDAEMGRLLGCLLKILKVAVISGGNWLQFEHQLLSRLSADDNLINLSLLPTCGTASYHYEAGWKLLYLESFTAQEKTKIITALVQATNHRGFKEKKTWGGIDRRPREPDHLFWSGSECTHWGQEKLGSRVHQERED